MDFALFAIILKLLLSVHVHRLNTVVNMELVEYIIGSTGNTLK